MTLKVHHLRPAPGAKTAKTRVGRGEAGKRGKTAGRGTKGTKARYQVPASFEGGQMPLHMRLPKLKGFKNNNKIAFQVVNVATLASLYPSGGEVTVDDLVAKGAVRKGEPVKVLGNGDLAVALTVTVDAASRVGQGQDRGRRRIGHDRLIARTRRAAASSSGRSSTRADCLGWAGPPSVACLRSVRAGHSRGSVRFGLAVRLCGVWRTLVAPSGGSPCTCPRSPQRSARRTCARSCSSPWASLRSTGSAP